jgi:hypothetical protein
MVGWSLIPNSDSFESDTEFDLIGILLGIAIYNSIIVDFHMPKVCYLQCISVFCLRRRLHPLPLCQVIYKKLKGESVTLQDLAELQRLEQLLVFSGDVQSAFQFNFQISHESLGEIRNVISKGERGRSSCDEPEQRGIRLSCLTLILCQSFNLKD